MMAQAKGQNQIAARATLDAPGRQGAKGVVVPVSERDLAFPHPKGGFGQPF